MKIHTRDGDLPFSQLTFPDGQRHFHLMAMKRDDLNAVIEIAITSSDALFDVLMAKSVLDQCGYVTSLDVRYLLGARMDRSIDAEQPCTLEIVCRALLAAGFAGIRVLDPHSPKSLRLLRAEPMSPGVALDLVLDGYRPATTVVVAPDAGAEGRVRGLVGHTAFHVVQGRKKRDPATGALSGFAVDDASFVAGKSCLMVDDICDGGGTFVGLAEVLTAAGASSVDLFVTHGIFSQGLPLRGIRQIYTTDSLPGRTSGGCLTVIPVDMSATFKW